MLSFFVNLNEIQNTSFLLLRYFALGNFVKCISDLKCELLECLKYSYCLEADHIKGVFFEKLKCFRWRYASVFFIVIDNCVKKDGYSIIFNQMLVFLVSNVLPDYSLSTHVILKLFNLLFTKPIFNIIIVKIKPAWSYKPSKMKSLFIWRDVKLNILSPSCC